MAPARSFVKRHPILTAALVLVVVFLLLVIAGTQWAVPHSINRG